MSAAALRSKGLLPRDSRSQLSIFAQWKSFGIVRDHLNANVIRACGVMLLDTIQYCLQIAPGDHGIDKLVASSIFDIRFLKSQAQPIVRVIGQGQVDGKKFPGDGPRLSWIFFKYHGLLRTQIRTRAEQFTRLGSV